MTPLLENNKLVTDLDCNHFSLLNVKSFFPLPQNIVTDDDVRLSDARLPLPGSIDDTSIAIDAAIDQSKLDLSGDIPSNWLGTTSGTAAQGDLAEYKTNKGTPGGYAELDNTGKVPSLQLPNDVGAGTVTSVGLNMPLPFSVAGSPITGSGTIAVTWANQPDQSWFGNNEGAPHAPKFYTDPLPTDLIPDLDASKVVSGTFDAALLPAAVGIGVSHAAGAVPDPGAGGGGADATDYLGRDMAWHTVPSIGTGASYQPQISDPVINHSTNPTGAQTITVKAGTGAETGLTFFYSLTSDSADFVEFPNDTGFISLDPTDEVWVYAAAAGYTNSDVVNYTNPNP